MTARNVVLVTGGRSYADRAHVFAVLDAIHAERPIAVIVEGAARGADQLASEWAVAREVENKRMPADWNAHGKGAGPRRNTAMAGRLRSHAHAYGQDSVLVVAFPGGRGTANMIAQARGKQLPVRPCCPSHPLESTR